MTRTRTRSRPALLASVAAAVALVRGLTIIDPASATEASGIRIASHQIPSFLIGEHAVTEFGSLRWRGGLEIEADRRLGGLSGIVVDPDGRGFLAISDDGRMLRAVIERDDAGRPIGLGEAAMRPMQGPNGDLTGNKMESDTEAIDIAESPEGRTAYVSKEARPAVLRGPVEPDGFVGRLEAIQLPEETARLRWTKGLESLAVAPPGHPLGDALVVIAERPIRGEDTTDRPGWIVGGPNAGRFEVADDGFDITDAKFGPGGDLFLLGRLFNLSDGVRMRISRVPAAELAAGARLEPSTLAEASLAHQIDNMEGLAIWTDAAGRTILSLVSDDNRSFLQRTLYLEFELLQ